MIGSTRPGLSIPFDGAGRSDTPSLRKNSAIARILDAVSASRHQLLDVAVRQRPLKAGDILVREKHSSATLLFLEDGWACRFVTTRDGKRHIPSVIVPGDVCNLEALMYAELDCGIQMLTSGTALSIALPIVRDLQTSSPEVALAIAALALTEKVMLAKHTLRLGRLTARERLIHLLCELSYRTGHQDLHRADRASMEIPLTQECLADLLGLTTVHVNRTLQQLRSEGLLESRSHRIVVPDVGILKELSDFDPAYLAPLAHAVPHAPGKTFA